MQIDGSGPLPRSTLSSTPVTEHLRPHVYVIVFGVTGVKRRSKVLLLDPDGRVLLFSGTDPAQPRRPPIWFPVGGRVDEGETLEEAAVREVEEETGLVVSDLGPVVMTRHVDFTFDGDSYDQHEAYFVVRTDAFVPDPKGWTETEQRVVVCSRWWSLDDLRATDETVYPEGLAGLLRQPVGGHACSARPEARDTGSTELAARRSSRTDT